jgi:hypothetical protein
MGFFKDWMVKVERFTERKVKAVRSDNGGEYTSKEFEDHLRLLGIEHQTTVPYSSQQNGAHSPSDPIAPLSNAPSPSSTQSDFPSPSGLR